MSHGGAVVKLVFTEAKVTQLDKGQLPAVYHQHLCAGVGCVGGVWAWGVGVQGWEARGGWACVLCCVCLCM